VIVQGKRSKGGVKEDRAVVLTAPEIRHTFPSVGTGVWTVSKTLYVGRLVTSLAVVPTVKFVYARRL